MHPVVNHMIQLQEMNLIRTEKKAAKKKIDLSSLEASISKMTSELQPDTQALFTRLKKKDPIVIVPISNATCASCGMSLPISLVQSVKRAEEILQCPACARILYFPETAARRVGKPQRRSEPRKVGFSRFSSHTLMIPKLEATDRDGAIAELTNLMTEEGFIDDGEKMANGVIARENIMSTAVEHGIAFPHSRGIEGGGIAVAVGLSKKGIKFDSGSRNLTKIIFLISIPTAASAFYLKLLAGMTESLRNKEARELLLTAKDPDALWKSLTKITRSHIK